MGCRLSQLTLEEGWWRRQKLPGAQGLSSIPTWLLLFAGAGRRMGKVVSPPSLGPSFLRTGIIDDTPLGSSRSPAWRTAHSPVPSQQMMSLGCWSGNASGMTAEKGALSSALKEGRRQGPSIHILGHRAVGFQCCLPTPQPTTSRSVSLLACLLACFCFYSIKC